MSFGFAMLCVFTIMFATNRRNSGDFLPIMFDTPPIPFAFFRLFFLGFPSSEKAITIMFDTNHSRAIPLNKRQPHSIAVCFTCLWQTILSVLWHTLLFMANIICKVANFIVNSQILCSDNKVCDKIPVWMRVN